MDSDKKLKLMELERRKRIMEEDMPIEPTSSPIDLAVGGGLSNVVKLVPRTLGMLAKDEAKDVARQAWGKIALNAAQKKGAENAAKEAAKEAVKDVVTQSASDKPKVIASFPPLRGQGKADNMGGVYRRDSLMSPEQVRQNQLAEWNKQTADELRKQALAQMLKNKK